MGYFDYLEAEHEKKREFMFFDSWARKGFWTNIATLGVFLATIICYIFVAMGSTFIIAIFNFLGLILAVLSIIFSSAAIKMAHSKRLESPLASMSCVWSIFWGLMHVTLIVMDLWMFFT